MQKPRGKCKIRAANAKADLLLKPLTVPLIKPCLTYYCSYVTVRADPASTDSPFLLSGTYCTYSNTRTSGWGFVKWYILVQSNYNTRRYHWLKIRLQTLNLNRRVQDHPGETLKALIKVRWLATSYVNHTSLAIWCFWSTTKP